MINNIGALFLTIRDLLIPFLPRFIVRLFMGKGEYVFLAHPIELLPDIARKYPFADKLSKGMLKIISRHHPPVVLAKVTGYKGQDGRHITGWVVFCSMSTRMMVLHQALAKKKILKAAKFSEKLGAKLLGLGAFVPIVTEHGAYLQGKISMSITNGDAFSAVIAVKNVLKATDIAGLDKNKIQLAIVGASGFVGSISCKLLLKYFTNILLIDKNMAGLNGMFNQLKQTYPTLNISSSENIHDIKDADIVLTVTNTPGAIVRSNHLKSGSIVIDAAQPRNVSVKVPREREDVVVIESGIAEVEGLKVNCDFGLRKENEVYSCFAELLLLCWMKKYDEDHVDPIPEEYVLKLWEVSEKAGIRVADFRNINGFIHDDRLKNLRRKA